MPTAVNATVVRSEHNAAATSAAIIGLVGGTAPGSATSTPVIASTKTSPGKNAALVELMRQPNPGPFCRRAIYTVRRGNANLGRVSVDDAAARGRRSAGR